MKPLISAKTLKIIGTLIFVTAVPHGWAASQTVTLNVAGMTCPACPVSVKKALFRIEGVNNIVIHYEQREIVVTFDDTKTDIKKITTATENAGYPSTEKPRKYL